MISLKYKTWRAAGAAAAMGLAACGQGQSGPAADGQAGPANDETAVVPSPAADMGGEGGESGEAGAVSAYTGLVGDQLAALRLQHLKGFVMAAGRVVDENKPMEAGILVQQGMLEVHDASPDQFGSLNAEILRTAGASDELNRAERKARIRAADEELDRAIAALRADHAVTTARMLDVATGLYQQVMHEGAVDPIEYQHSFGAALAAQNALASGEQELRRRDSGAYEDARRELARFVALWPSIDAPATPATYQQVLAQSSRVRLALSPYL